MIKRKKDSGNLDSKAQIQNKVSDKIVYFQKRRKSPDVLDASPASDESPNVLTTNQSGFNRNGSFQSIDNEADLSDGLNDGYSKINQIKSTRLDHTDKNKFMSKNYHILASNYKSNLNQLDDKIIDNSLVNE